MRQLAQVQFCTWSALFILWVFTTPAVVMVAFGTRGPASQAYTNV